MKPFAGGILAGGLIAVLAVGVTMTMAGGNDLAHKSPVAANASSSPPESEADLSASPDSRAAQQIQDTPLDAAARTLSLGGVSYALAINASGAVLTSADGRNIYLGRACDVQSDQFGKGRWEWSNAGFAIHFEGRDFAFPRMDPPLDVNACEA